MQSQGGIMLMNRNAAADSLVLSINASKARLYGQENDDENDESDDRGMDEAQLDHVVRGRHEQLR